MNENGDMTKILCHTLLNCKTEEDCLAQRVAAAKLLLEGKTYAEIMDSTEISSATLSRVSRAVRHGSGGYARLIPRDGR